jgi:short subunit dehydrogenase-like uncharacterized protein
MTNADRDFDVVLLGATGFTGQLVAEYLVKKRDSLRWALAGRSKGKLEQVRAGLAAADPAAKDLPILVADSLDPAAMRALAARARVVCTTVGPYAKYGEPLVAACAEAGTSYCDLTGETPFIRRAIDAHHARAAETGARIVSCCGFDSIPSDLGVFMLHDHLQKQGDRLAEAHYRLVRAQGGASGGTVASMMGLMENLHDPAVRRALGDPYALDPDGSTRGPDGRDALGPGRDPDGRWTAPFIMAGVNTRVVRRSNALLDHAYGRDFRYDELIDTGKGARGLGRALAVSGAMVGVGALVATGPGRKLVARFLPAPGEGPSKEKRERGHFRVEIRAKSTAGKRLVGVVAGNLDPGYGQTSVMLGEAALCLAKDDLRTPSGVVTPAVAMGMTLVERLRAAGMTFRVED